MMNNSIIPSKMILQTKKNSFFGKILQRKSWKAVTYYSFLNIYIRYPYGIRLSNAMCWEDITKYNFIKIWPLKHIAATGKIGRN